MLISEMYKIEKILHSYRMAGITDVRELINLSDYHRLSTAGLIYYYRAVIIPYAEMLEHIDYYNNYMMDEGEELFWLQKLTNKYNKVDDKPIMFSGNDTVYRFKDVERLSKSLIYGKKMEKLLNDGQDNIKSDRQGLVRKRVFKQ